ENRKIRSRWCRAEATDQLIAGHDGHVEVDGREIDPVFVEAIECLLAVRSFMYVAEREPAHAKCTRDHRAHDGAIVDDQDIEGHMRHDSEIDGEALRHRG